MAIQQSGLRPFWCVTLLSALALAGCGGSGGAPTQETVAADVSDDDLQLAKLAYSPEQRVPEQFYQEVRLYPDRSEFRFHVKASDVGLDNGGNDFDLCSNDFAEALQWSAQSAISRQFDTSLSGTAETDWYFQFERTINDDEPGMLINRVFKCASFDRTGSNVIGFAGRIAKDNVDAADLRFVSEYLWQFSVYNNALNAVSSSATEATGLGHVIERVAVLVGGGSRAGCDRIEVWHWRHELDPGNGDLVSEQQFVYGFDARQTNGQVVLCD